MILVTDGKSSDSFRIPAEKLKSANVEIFAVGVKGMLEPVGRADVGNDAYAGI